MGFKDDAIKAFEDSCKAAELDVAKRLADSRKEAVGTLRRYFQDTFGYEPESVQAEGMTAMLDGITFHLAEHKIPGQYSYMRTWHVGYQCPECGEWIWSQEVRDIEDVGRQLTDFHPIYNHNHECAPSEEEEQESFERFQAREATEAVRDADWPEWLVIGKHRIHWPRVNRIEEYAHGGIGIDFGTSNEIFDLTLDGDDATKFLTWWNLRQKRDDVVTL